MKASVIAERTAKIPKITDGNQLTCFYIYFLHLISSLNIISPVKKEYTEQEHHQDHHQVTQYQVQLSERMLETTLLYMYIQQKMTLKSE